MNPLDHYWIKEDGTLYGSKAGGEVEASDPAYADWLKAGNAPTRWPRDDHGLQTADALQQVLDTYPGMFASLENFVPAARWAREEAGVTVQIGGKPVPMSTRRIDRAGQQGALAAIEAGTRTDGASFKFADGVSRPAKNDDLKAGILQGLAHVQACFDEELKVLKLVTSGKIKTRDEVEARFAAVA